MSNRPGKLCKMTKGKVIGYQSNFADTWNWMVDCIKNLRGGKNCSVDWESSDTPVVNVGENTAAGVGGGGGGGGGSDLSFASASDSNVTFSRSGNTVTVGVYYK